MESAQEVVVPLWLEALGALLIIILSYIAAKAITRWKFSGIWTYVQKYGHMVADIRRRKTYDMHSAVKSTTTVVMFLCMTIFSLAYISSS
ncbi:MAG: hypothetical protein ACTSXJ_10965 [Candidatus Baldrarchaeia archaeon]